jgi:CRISPR/Cas system CSM-associated protein Csm4 (group 5 of RAMP superfamily)
LSIKKLRRVFETAEKGLDRYLHPKLKKMKYFTVKELEKFIDLGHSAKDFLNLMEEHKQIKLPDASSSKVLEQFLSPKNNDKTPINNLEATQVVNFARNDSEIVLVNEAQSMTFLTQEQ